MLHRVYRPQLVNEFIEIADYDDVLFFHIRGMGVRDFYDEDEILIQKVHD